MNQLMDGACAAAAREDDRVVLAGVHCISDDVPVEVSNKTSSFKKVKMVHVLLLERSLSMTESCPLVTAFCVINPFKNMFKSLIKTKNKRWRWRPFFFSFLTRNQLINV